MVLVTLAKKYKIKTILYNSKYYYNTIRKYKAIQYNIAGQSNIADHNYANSLRKLIFHRTGSLKN